MQQQSIPRLTPARGLDNQLRQLAAIEPGATGFVSCYLELDGLRRHGTSQLERRASTFRGRLGRDEQAHFDEAFDMVRGVLGHQCPDEARGVAVFARGAAGGRALHVVWLPQGCGERVNWYRVPDLQPLAALVDALPHFVLALVRRRGIEVIDVHPGHAVSRAWSAVVPGVDVPGGAAGPSDNAVVARLDPHARLVHRALVAGPGVPIVLAGDAEAMQQFRHWLPRRLRARIIDEQALPHRCGSDDAVARARRVVQRHHRAAAERLASRLVGSVRAHRYAVAGPIATLDALASGLAETVVISRPSAESAPGRVCDDCASAVPTSGLAGAVARSARQRCAACGSTAVSAWDPFVELVRLAWQNGVRVVVADSSELTYLGGVGCLVRREAGRRLMTRPRLGRRLDLVA